MAAFFNRSIHFSTKNHSLVKKFFLAQELAKPLFILTNSCACMPMVKLNIVNKETGDKSDYKGVHLQLRIKMFSFYIASKYAFLLRQVKALQCSDIILIQKLPVILNPFLYPCCSTANIHPMIPPIEARGNKEYPKISGIVLIAV